MLENHAGVCLEHEHNWCAIPLHEDAQICAKCGQIRESHLSDFCDTEDFEIESVACGHEGSVAVVSIIPAQPDSSWAVLQRHSIAAG
jgi:hypothetical protein